MYQALLPRREGPGDKAIVESNVYMHVLGLLSQSTTLWSVWLPYCIFQADDKSQGQTLPKEDRQLRSAPRPLKPSDKVRYTYLPVTLIYTYFVSSF